MYSRYDKIISISHQTQSNLLDWLSVTQINNKFVIINNGVDLNKFNQCEVECSRNILMVSRFSNQKDQSTLIRSIPYIIDKNISFLFAGDGETRSSIEFLTKKLGVSHRCIFLGNVSNVSALIQNSYIGVQSSFWEGFGLTAVEFMACGKPIIATNVDGLKQVVDGAGLLFPLGDEKILAEHINSLLTNNEMYNNISSACLERSRKYDIAIMVDKYIDVYKQLKVE